MWDMSWLPHMDEDVRPADPSDDEFMAMYREGDIDAFDVLFDRHHVAVYNLARFVLRDPVGAEEIMQETFLVVARAGRRYEPRGRFRAWLMGITRNRCLNRDQSERARRAVVKESGLDVVDTASSDPSPPERVERDERAAMLRQAIEELPERQREAIVLYAFEDMAYREIAETLGMPLNSVKTLIHRARANLAEALRKAQGEKEDAV